MISRQAGRALNLIQSIRLSKDADADFWRGLVTRIVIDLDEQAAERDVTRIADLLAVAYGRLEDKEVADVREVSPGLWTSGPSLVELDAYGTDPREDRPDGTEADDVR